MRRIITVLAVMAIMAAILVADALPAFAAANEDKSSCRGDSVSDSVTDPLNPPPPYTGSSFGFGGGTKKAAHDYQQDQQGGKTNYGQNWVSMQGQGTLEFCPYV